MVVKKNHVMLINI